MERRPQQLDNRPATAIRSNADFASDAATGPLPADALLLRAAPGGEVSGLHDGPVAFTDEPLPPPVPLPCTADPLRSTAQTVTGRQNSRRRSDPLLRHAPPGFRARPVIRAVSGGAWLPRLGPRPMCPGRTTPGRGPDVSEQRTVRHHRRKAQHEEGNAHQCPPAGGKPHCDR